MVNLLSLRKNTKSFKWSQCGHFFVPLNFFCDIIIKNVSKGGEKMAVKQKEDKLLNLINEFKSKGRSVYTQSDDESAKVSLWYVIAKLEELWISNHLSN